ncbi:fumarate hydratase [Paenibacillus thalictri]|uniref:Fumarate hydratase n=1 Tax=Paenibacillus thalictri TaxID=2527873 RepID=A0A4Q9DP51_9BACL|nr:fumarate hydratase [Paenibacillus thalictri]TBL75988.1 fumarate hydratase [Paenibacillus thalictri]
MREVDVRDIVDKVRELCMQANYDLGDDTVSSMRLALNKEVSETGKDVLQILLENAELAAAEKVPMCQDTGVAVVMAEVGQDCRIVGGSLYDAINEGVRRGYKDGYLRSSIVGHPLQRVNTGDNTPAVIHTELVPGDRLKLKVTAKGGGSENMSALRMLKPADGLEGVKRFIVDTVRIAGPNACPPLVVGVGIGGSFEKCALLAKRALFRPVGERNALPDIAELEEELLKSINRLGIGPQGMGGIVTALDVKVEIYACHIASLPVAVNLNCHANRHKEVTL